MEPDTLINLLHHADATAPAPPALRRAARPSPAGDDLASWVRRRAIVRVRGRRALATIVLGLACGALLVPAALFHSRNPPPLAIQPDLTRLTKELAALDSEAELHIRTARAMERMEAATKRRLADGQMPWIDPIIRLNGQRELAAEILLREADWMAMQAGRHDRAEIVYRRAANLFSDTPAGVQARRRLGDGV